MLLLLLSIFASSNTYASIINCGTPMTKFMIQSLSQSPIDVIKSGENLTLNLFYTNYETILSGSTTTSVTYNFIPLNPTIAPLCDSILCPLEPGTHDGSTSAVFPSGLSGTVSTTIRWKNDVNEELLCIRSTLKAT